jgi:SAM-dependent methyltransferase
MNIHRTSEAGKPGDLTGRLYPEVAAGGFTRVDGTVQFYTRVAALVRSNSVVLDIGAGRGQAESDDPVAYRRSLRNLKGRAARVIGIDVDPAVMSNPTLDEARMISDGVFPVEDQSVDLALADATFEHIPSPEAFCREIERVLKPGGWLCARTPNKRGYISLSARMVPNRLHRAVLKRAQPDRKAEDVFPTVYKLNTRRDIERFLPGDRWQHSIFAWDAEPAYFGNSLPLWRLAQGFFAISPPALRSTLMIFSRKIG